jgi:hypothetical protein
MIRRPKFTPKLGISGGRPPQGGGRPTSQEVMNKLKERNPGNLWRSSLYPAFVAQHAGLLTPVTATLAYDPVLMGIGKAFGIDEISNIQDIAREDPYALAHEVTSKLAGGETYSDEWFAAKNAAAQESAREARGPLRPKGSLTSRGLSSFQTPQFAKTMNNFKPVPVTGINSWF